MFLGLPHLVRSNGLELVRLTEKRNLVGFGCFEHPAPLCRGGPGAEFAIGWQFEQQHPLQAHACALPEFPQV